MLVVIGGLPGVGKSTIARLVAERYGAVYLRIDVIEQAMRAAGVLAGDDVGPAGYMAAYGLAEANLRLGRPVVADCVNPIATTRQAWRAVAARASSPILEVEVVCSDAAEHRRRVETRATNIPGLVPPSWAAVTAREYEPWPEADLRIDTARATADEAAAMIEGAALAGGALSARRPGP